MKDPESRSCARCGRCCTSFGVCITPFDIARITRAAGRKPEGFVTVLPEPPERERTEPAVLIDGKMSLLILRWKKGGGRECIFYSGEGCCIYNCRPILCRTYPFKRNKHSLEDMCSRACLSYWKPDAEGIKAYTMDCREYGQELEAYRKIAEEWNGSGGGTLKKFFMFAIVRLE